MESGNLHERNYIGSASQEHTLDQTMAAFNNEIKLVYGHATRRNEEQILWKVLMTDAPAMGKGRPKTR